MSLYKNAKGELIELTEKEALQYQKLSKLTIIGDSQKEKVFKTAKVELVNKVKKKPEEKIEDSKDLHFDSSSIEHE